MHIGEARLSAKGRELHFPPHVEEQLLEDDPEDIKTQCFFVGDKLRIKIPNNPYDLIVDVPLTEWTMRERPYKRSFRDRDIYAKKWLPLIDTDEDEEGEYVRAEIHIATTENVSYSSILKTTDRGLTRHEAREIVNDYYEEHHQVRSYVKAPDVLRHYDAENNLHNVTRIRDVLEQRFESVGLMNGTKTFDFTEGEA